MRIRNRDQPFAVTMVSSEAEPACNVFVQATSSVVSDAQFESATMKLLATLLALMALPSLAHALTLECHVQGQTFPDGSHVAEQTVVNEINAQDGWVITDNLFSKTQEDGVEIQISRYSGKLTARRQGTVASGTCTVVEKGQRKF